ncbi:hypothetical protein [Nocardiopsis composta]|uniref:Uncharacterized protein n=1 Tax=Nocardiopsis composta TaxID=157465 RepID=A0A7W8QQD2_9ACTN|nr:hypothetical protein [Nocardiopsis composta]MBB5434647.1 hypothetical protein [Nocardiopsis composta]
MQNGFGQVMVAAFADARIEAEYVPPAGVRVVLPDGRSTEMDLSAAFQHVAAEVPEAEQPDFAAGVVRGMMRSFRRSGIRIGTHYPLPADDAAGHALLAAFREAGHRPVFEEPGVLSVELGDGGKAVLKVDRYRAAAEGASEQEMRVQAAEFAAAAARDFARGEEQSDHTGGDTAALRLRLYPEGMLTEELRRAVVTRELADGVWETVAVDHPDSVQPLSRGAVEGPGAQPIDRLFQAAVENSLAEPSEVSEHEYNGVKLLHIGGEHFYMAAHAHVLGRYLGRYAPLENGALVAFPVPQVVLINPFGAGHPIAAMEAMQELAERFVEGDKPISAQVFWWRPRAAELADPGRAPAQDHRPDLRQVRVEVDHEAKSVSIYGDEDFRALLNRLMAEE